WPPVIGCLIPVVHRVIGLIAVEYPHRRRPAGPPPLGGRWAGEPEFLAPGLAVGSSMRGPGRGGNADPFADGRVLGAFRLPRAARRTVSPEIGPPCLPAEVG